MTSRPVRRGQGLAAERRRLQQEQERDEYQHPNQLRYQHHLQYRRHQHQLHHRRKSTLTSVIGTARTTSPARMRFPQGARTLRIKFVLLALPASIVLIFLTSVFYRRDLHSQRVFTHSKSNDVLPTSKWTGEQQDRREQCWAQWVSTGTVCKGPPNFWSPQDRLDLVWMWNNASLTSSPSSLQSKDSSRTVSDLLRYSFRSAQRYMQSGFGTVTLLTPDVPIAPSTDSAAACTHAYTDSQGLANSGQRPCWLSTADPVYEPPSLLHHRQVACADESGLAKHRCADAASSVAASASASDSLLLAAVAPELSDVRLAISPHHIFAAPVSASDFWTPLYGPVFRLGSSAETDEIPIANADAVGTLAEDAPIIRANALLNQRFGERPRRKLLDLPQPISKTVVAELQQTWPNQLDLSSSHDLGTLHAHYTAERYREALLWSFLVAKHDRDADGVYSTQEATALLRDLGAADMRNPSFPVVHLPMRSSLESSTVALHLKHASLTARLSHQFLQSSIDGSAFYVPRSSSESSLGGGNVGSDADAADATQTQKTEACKLEMVCVQSLLMANGSTVKPSVSELFSQVTYRLPSCGDCMVLHLVGKSGLQGLSAFLPDDELVMPPLAALPSPPTFEKVDVSIKPASGSTEKKRLDVVTGLLSRYMHSIILEETFVTPAMTNRSATAESLSTLEFFDNSSAFGFRQHGSPSPTPRAEDTWIWVKYVRAWLSVRYPLVMRFESHTSEL
ncbi:hypothetical protein EX895_002796 [Sporisorium graminicola]|uniref:Uncharacterized protein n=1 Tax=Sporisorium graminicola TaxID=280036 RepID=A0A4U7KUX1_9BASI|nr:hypothetical protein EX895_002796 [Sporisorium graminicola]TKY88444.1 hypothetical protein EX895_002796 [Sporisorium graminicola]